MVAQTSTVPVGWHAGAEGAPRSAAPVAFAPSPAACVPERPLHVRRWLLQLRTLHRPLRQSAASILLARCRGVSTRGLNVPVLHTANLS